MSQKIAQGAEAILVRDKNRIIKERIKKNYRIKEVDVDKYLTQGSQ